LTGIAVERDRRWLIATWEWDGKSRTVYHRIH